MLNSSFIKKNKGEKVWCQVKDVKGSRTAVNRVAKVICLGRLRSHGWNRENQQLCSQKKGNGIERRYLKMKKYWTGRTWWPYKGLKYCWLGTSGKEAEEMTRLVKHKQWEIRRGQCLVKTALESWLGLCGEMYRACANTCHSNWRERLERKKVEVEWNSGKRLMGSDHRI